MRQKIKVTIYQRVKYGTKWGRKRIAIPPLKKDGTLFFKDDRQGIFQSVGTRTDRSSGKTSKAESTKRSSRSFPMPLRRRKTNPGS